MKKLVFIIIILINCTVIHADSVEKVFTDDVLANDIKLPDWFKLSFLDLKDDLIEAEESKKKGLIIYFGRKDCPYCKAFIENNWSRQDIVHYTRKNFDVIAINTKGKKGVTDFDSYVYEEKQYAIKMKTNFTPSVLFYSTDEKLILKLSGYQQPYRFLAALEYVADKHYTKHSFASYLAQANESLGSNGQEELNTQPYFDMPPFNLNRKHFNSTRPLAVFFETKFCHACDILHSNPLEDSRIIKQLNSIDVVQVEQNSTAKVITPDGEKLTAHQWAGHLELNYSPTIIFFDEKGKEIIRVDSVVWVNRLGRVLDYVTSRAYKRFSSFQEWRLSKSK